MRVFLSSAAARSFILCTNWGMFPSPHTASARMLHAPVRRDDEHTLQKLLGPSAPRRPLDAGGAAVDAQTFEGALVRRDGLVERELLRVDRLEHQQRHRQLGDACGVVLLVGVLFVEDLARFLLNAARCGAGVDVDLLKGGMAGTLSRETSRPRTKKEQKSGVFSWKCTWQYVTIKFDRTTGGRLARARRYSTFSITKNGRGVQPWNGRKKAEAHISFWRS